MKAGIYPDLSNEAYHADKAIGSSGLKEFAECPALYEYKYLNPKGVKKAESKYSGIGSHAHVALLEPHLFAKNYIVAPEFAIVNKGKKSQKSTPMNKAHGDWDVFKDEAVILGQEPLLYSEFQQASAMAAAIKKHDLASSMLTGGKAEMSFFAIDEQTGLMMKARPDYLVSVKGIGVVLVDYKTTAISLGTSKQSNHAFKLGRQIQAAHHKAVTELATGGKIDEVCYVVQMQEPPYLIRCLGMTPEAIATGDEQRRQYLDGIAECYAKRVWPDYPHVIEDMIMPRWMDYEFN